MKSVLFLSTANAARSQMAEGFLRMYGGENFLVCSAGLEPTEIHPYTLQVMDKIGVDIRSYWAKSTTEFMAKYFFHFIVTVCADAEQNCPRALWAIGGKKAHWDFDNPLRAEGSEEEKLAKFRQVRDEVHTAVKNWVEEQANLPET